MSKGSGMKKIIIVAAIASAATLAGCGSSPEPTAKVETVTATVTAEATPTPTYSDSFLEWASTHKVGSIDLPALVASNPEGVAQFAQRYCPILTGKPLGDAEMVVLVIKKNTNGSSEQASELLEQAVAAYCPEKSRLLN